MISGVPLFENELSSMLSIEVHGDAVVTTNEVKDEKFDFSKTWYDQNFTRLCLSKNQGMFMKIGATMRNIYQSSSGQKLAELTINTRICNEWRIKKEKEFVDDIQSMKIPKKIDELSAIIGADYKDKTMTYRYALALPPPDDAWKATVKQNMCHDDNFKVMVQLGMTIRAEFEAVKADSFVPLGEIVMDATSCEAQLP